MIINNNSKNSKNKSIGNYIVDSLQTREKCLPDKDFYFVDNEINKKRVLCLKQNNKSSSFEVDGVRNSAIKLSKIIATKYNELINYLRCLQGLTNNKNFISKLSEMNNILLQDYEISLVIYKRLSGFEFEVEGYNCNIQSFCFGIINALDKVGEIIKELNKLNKLIDIKMINKELDAFVNNLFLCSHMLMRIQVACYK